MCNSAKQTTNKILDAFREYVTEIGEYHYNESLVTELFTSCDTATNKSLHKLFTKVENQLKMYAHDFHVKKITK